MRLAWCVVLLIGAQGAAGCLSGSRWGDREPPANRSRSLEAADRIEIRASMAPGIPGPGVSHEVVLEKNGPCLVRVTPGVDGEGTTEYELPAGTLEEARKILAQADFFLMKSAYPAFFFESSSKSITASHGGTPYTVAVIGQAVPPPGFDRVWEFATSLARRGTKVERARETGQPAPVR